MENPSEDSSAVEAACRKCELLKSQGKEAEAKKVLRGIEVEATTINKVLEVCDKCGWKEEKLAFKEQLLSSNLAGLQAEGASAKLIETLHLISSIAEDRYSIKVDQLREEFKLQFEELSAKQRNIPSTYTEEANSEGFEALIRSDMMYSYEFFTDTLFLTNTKTRRERTMTIEGYEFKARTCWCVAPSNQIFFTGGGPSDEVVSIDADTFTLSRHPPLQVSRFCHNSAYFDGFVYVVGGCDTSQILGDCERYSLASKQWETIERLNAPAAQFSLVVLHKTRCMYALGGYDYQRSQSGNIQEFSFDRLTWKQCGVKLPLPQADISGFTIQEQADLVFFVQDYKVYSFQPLTQTIEVVKQLEFNVEAFEGPSCYSDGTLYTSKYFGPVMSYELGDIY
mmetsp:Transcript_10883/g.21278  ORF Transcript_10883/g.21278 Transcript_10883/m.21278 type:complete len:395 (+) Transcript_10883:3075-4259(+)